MSGLLRAWRGRQRGALVALLVVLAAAGIAADLLFRGPGEAVVVAAVPAMFVIAWQSWQTRRAAEAAERGLKSAEESIQVSLALAVEAERARLDARAPRILIDVGAPAWPPYGVPVHHSALPNPYGEGQVFRLPKDAELAIGLSASVAIRNEGDRAVKVACQNLEVRREAGSDLEGNVNQRWELPGPGGCEEVLQPGHWLEVRLNEARPARDWVENDEARRRGGVGPNAIIAEVIVGDSLDNGVIDNWTIELGGYPLETVDDELGAWCIPCCTTTYRPVHAIVRPAVRRYFRSKVRNQPLPSVDLPSSTGEAP